jgi:hypothetical protein
VRLTRIEVNGYSVPAGDGPRQRQHGLGFIHGFEAAIEWAAKYNGPKSRMRKAAGRVLWEDYQMAGNIKGGLPVPPEAYAKPEVESSS